jgi:hypothetical protein
MKSQWSKLGGLLGIAYCLAGLFLIFLGWNGAATYDREPAQIPYLVSGGLGGLALVVIGASLFVVQSLRADRAALRESLDELRVTIEQAAGMGGATPATGAGGETEVVAGPTTYHRPGCTLVEGQPGLSGMTLAAAIGHGLEQCRVCNPG